MGRTRKNNDTMSFYINIASRIKNARFELGLSQAELAEKAGISRETVSKVESGRRDIKMSTIAFIIEALNESADYILYGKRTEKSEARLLQITEQFSYSEWKILDNVIRVLAESSGILISGDDEEDK